MKLYKITATKGETRGEFFRYAHSPEEAIAEWLEDNPFTRVINCIPWHKKIPVGTIPHKKSHNGAKSRAYLKARITQMMRNAQSILEDEDALVTMEERLQLSRIICQQNRILALWAERSMQLKLEGLLD